MNIHAVYRPFLLFFRKKRALRLRKELSFKGSVLDVGGMPRFWEQWFADVRSKITCLNLSLPDEKYDKQKYTCIVGDGCSLPFSDDAFDLCFSNSVIEHMGSLPNQEKFAREIRRTGRSYYVQTPYKWFFIEPHYITPFVHWLPKKFQKKVLRDFSVWGLVARPTKEYAERLVDEIRLLTRKEMKALFPDAKVYFEWFLFFPKHHCLQAR